MNIYLVTYTRWRNYNRYALYLSVHCTVLRADISRDISVLVRRYLCLGPKISPPVGFMPQLIPPTGNIYPTTSPSRASRVRARPNKAKKKTHKESCALLWA